MHCQQWVLRKLSVLLFFGFSLLPACGPSADTKAACDLSTRWNVASSAVASVLADLENSSKFQIREAMSEAVATLVAFNAVAPREIRSETELLLNSYGALADAFEAIDWQGSSSRQDAAVASAGVRLESDEIQNAQSDFADFIKNSCSVELLKAINKFPNTGETLPDPIIQDELNAEKPATFDNEDSVSKAFGYVVVERFGLAITDDQAECVGSSLLAATSDDAEIVDKTYWQMLQTIFDTCAVKIDVASALENE